MTMSFRVRHPMAITIIFTGGWSNGKGGHGHAFPVDAEAIFVTTSALWSQAGINIIEAKVYQCSPTIKKEGKNEHIAVVDVVFVASDDHRLSKYIV